MRTGLSKKVAKRLAKKRWDGRVLPKGGGKVVAGAKSVSYRKRRKTVVTKIKVHAGKRGRREIKEWVCSCSGEKRVDKGVMADKENTHGRKER